MNILKEFFYGRTNRVGFLVGVAVTELLFSLYLYLRQYIIDQPAVTVAVWILAFTGTQLLLYYFISSRLRDTGHPGWWGVLLILISFNPYPDLEGVVLLGTIIGYGYLLFMPGKEVKHRKRG